MADNKEQTDDSPEKDKKVLYVRLDKELHDEFAKIAKKQNRKLTNMAEHLIQLYVQGRLIELPEPNTSPNNPD